MFVTRLTSLAVAAGTSAWRTVGGTGRWLSSVELKLSERRDEAVGGGEE